MEKIDSEKLFVRLVSQYQNLVFSICLKMTGDYFTAEDLTQESFLAVYKHLVNWKEETEKAWICRIATNKCIDYMRGMVGKALPVEDTELHSQTVPTDNKPLEQIINGEMMAELRSCCEALPPPYREVAVLYFLEGRPAKEVAERTQTELNTAKTRIRRAREMLKKSYRKELLQE